MKAVSVRSEPCVRSIPHAGAIVRGKGWLSRLAALDAVCAGSPGEKGRCPLVDECHVERHNVDAAGEGSVGAPSTLRGLLRRGKAYSRLLQIHSLEL